MPTSKDVLLKVFGTTTMSDMQHVVRRDEATKVSKIKTFTTSDTPCRLFISNTVNYCHGEMQNLY